MARFKTRRRARYWALRRLRFLPKEALEFSKLTHKYPALVELKLQRDAMWKAFTLLANSRGWGVGRRRLVWRTQIVALYAKLPRGFVDRDVHKRPIRISISPWDLYDEVFKRLPDELKWDTPRSSRSKVQQGEVKIGKIQMRRWIEDLKKSIQRTNDPEIKAQFREQIAGWEQALRTPG